MNVVDFKPVIDFGFQIAQGAVLTAMPLIVTYFLSRWAHINSQSALGQRIISIASNAAALGLSKANASADAASPTQVKSMAIAEGLKYFNAAVSQKTLDAAKISVPIDSMIEAQLQKLTIDQPAAAVTLGAPAAPSPPVKETTQ